MTTAENKQKFKEEAAIAIHDMELPTPDPMETVDFMLAWEMKRNFDSFKDSMMKLIDEL